MLGGGQNGLSDPPQVSYTLGSDENWLSEVIQASYMLGGGRNGSKSLQHGSGQNGLSELLKHYIIAITPFLQNLPSKNCSELPCIQRVWADLRFCSVVGLPSVRHMCAHADPTHLLVMWQGDMKRHESNETCSNSANHVEGLYIFCWTVLTSIKHVGGL